jgi:RND superfamily putative drug exporter
MRLLMRVGRWSARHPWTAIGLWTLFVAASLAAGIAVGTKDLANGAVGESERGYTLIDRHQLYGPPTEAVLVSSSRLITTDPAFKAAVTDLERHLHALRALSRFETPAVSADHHALGLRFAVTGYIDVTQIEAVVHRVAGAHPAVAMGETGDLSLQHDRDRSVNGDFKRAEYLAIPATLIVLLLAFGSLVAALVPVVLALSAVAATLGLLGPISQLIPLDNSVSTVVLLIGLAVGVDYALFYLVREREERRRGAAPHAALAIAARTSGRTVLISGLTVMIAMAGMYIVRSPVFSAIATGSILVVAMAVIGSLTVLPAILTVLGDRIERGRIPFVGRRRGPSRFWPAVVGAVLRRPWLSIGLSAGLLLVLAVPALGLRVAKPSDQALASQSLPAMRTLALAQREFPQLASQSAQVVLVLPQRGGAAARRAVAAFEHEAVAAHAAHPPFGVIRSGDGRAALIDTPLPGAGFDRASHHAVDVLRRRVVPATLGRLPGAETAVTGATAEDLDFSREMSNAIPYVIVFVLCLAFVLLLVSFRSIVVPLVAIVLNLLSVGASYGILVLVFQHHWAQGILGFHSIGSIIAWLPLFLFVILFGLSMDYHVFILSRIREAVDDGMATDEAIRHGISTSARVVTSAAAVMVVVFSIFGTLSSLDLKEAGVGLAVAVLLDATVIRAVLLPSTMAVLGDRNWYLPRALERLPRFAPEAR